MKSGTSARNSRRVRPQIEILESRIQLNGRPFGAMPEDSAEFLLGRVAVTVVFMESQPGSFPEPNLEDWTPAHTSETKAKISAGLQWWVDTLANQPASAIRPQPLEFVVDWTYADNPVSTPYEPIANPSNTFGFWIYDFINQVGAYSTGDFSVDMRGFNDTQRLAHDADWAFTIFVANSDHDTDDLFAPGGTFNGAFAFAGRFLVSPSGRPASTFAHEIGHMFWALDEYSGGGNFAQRRGYYDIQNLNAWDNPTASFVQADSIMANGTSRDNAFSNQTSSSSSLEMIGWRDTDSDGIFDVLDVPHTLTGSGYYDAPGGVYRFVGNSSVQTLINRNSSWLQNDITINRIRHAEFRIDGGPWQVAQSYGTYHASLDLTIPVSAPFGTIEIRTTDDLTGVTSPVFVGGPDGPTSVPLPGINGFVRHDADRDGALSLAETHGLAGWTVRLLDEDGQPLLLQQWVEPDDYPVDTALTSGVIAGVTLTAIGAEVPSGSNSVVVRPGNPSPATGSLVFHHASFFSGGLIADWSHFTSNLRMDFPAPVTSISLDAVGNGSSTNPNSLDFGRLEIFDASGQLLARYTTQGLGNGQFETMALNWPTADIAYAIARGHAGTAIQLDNLRFGPLTVAVTNAAGAYTIPNLPAGSYTVEAVAPLDWIVSVPASARHTVTIVAGGSLANVDFGGRGSRQSLFAIGAGVGGGPQVKVYDAATGTERFSFLAYAQTFSGGVRVATGDVDGDGIADIITAPGKGIQGRVRVFNGLDGSPLTGPVSNFLAFGRRWNKGLFVATGNLNADAFADLIVGQDRQGGQVRIFDGASGKLLRRIHPFGLLFRGGVTVAIGDTDGNGSAEIITGQLNGGSRVRTFRTSGGAAVLKFQAYVGYRGGVYVAAGDVDGDLAAEIITGTARGSTNQVKVFEKTNIGSPVTVTALDAQFIGGVRVAAVDRDSDGLAEVLVGAGPSVAGPQVKVLAGLGLGALDEFFAFAPGFAGGVFVG